MGVPSVGGRGRVVSGRAGWAKRWRPLRVLCWSRRVMRVVVRESVVGIVVGSMVTVWRLLLLFYEGGWVASVWRRV
jgi:hypothetical protein